VDALHAETFTALNGPADSIRSAAKIEERLDLLPLDLTRRVMAFKTGDRIQRHIFRRITAADWEHFFSHVISEIRREKGGATTTVDLDTASLLLYARAIENVQGYRTSDGREPRELPTWPECVHQKFRLRAIKTLMGVGMSRDLQDDELMLEADGVTVRLDALWTANEDGSMSAYNGLIHKFACPSAEHRRRYMRVRNRAFVAGGSRTGTTILPSSHGVLVKLYDELIERAEGYGVNGRPLSGKEETVREMDALHKSCAVGCIFQTEMAEEESERE
jgi:hypothetical protein